MKYVRFYFLVLFLGLSGCACVNKNHEKETVGMGIGAALGSALLGFLVEAAMDEDINILRRSGIALSPNVLNDLITNKLDLKPIQKTPVASQGMINMLTDTADNPGIAEKNEGQIITNWKRVPGKKAGLFNWEKTYECEVRHIITIRRSYQESDKSDLFVSTEVRERPNSNYPWSPADQEFGKDSLQNLTSQLSESIRAALDNKRVNK